MYDWKKCPLNIAGEFIASGIDFGGSRLVKDRSLGVWSLQQSLAWSGRLAGSWQAPHLTQGDCDWFGGEDDAGLPGPLRYLWLKSIHCKGLSVAVAQSSAT